jgi:BlaI family penicillinase repressor
MDGLPTPTARELEILKVLWTQGPSSVRAVHGALMAQGEEGLAYNTVQTMLRVMEAKQLVGHHTDGRTFIYSQRYSREESAARFLDRVFDGAACELMLTLIQAERVPADELDRMQSLIAAARGERRNGGAA